MRTYEIHDDGGVTERFQAETEAAAREYMREWMQGATFDASTGPVWYAARLYAVDSDGSTGEEIHSDEIRFDPPEPECTESEHAWEAPRAVVGGIAENPGVFGKGGGVVKTEVCRHCGRYRITDTWYQRPDTGAEGLEATYYRDPDTVSLDWVESLDGPADD